MWRRPLYFQDCIRIDEDIWFASGDYNGLYRYQLKEKKLERTATFPHEPFGLEGLFLKMCQYEKKLLFIPQHSKRLYIFDIENMIITDFSIPQLVDNIEPPYFFEAVVYGDHLYMMGAKYPGILKFNLKNGLFEIIDQWIKKLQNEIHLDIKGIYLGMKGVIEGSRFFVPCYQSNRVLEFDMLTEQCCFHKVGNDANRYARLIKSGDIFILVTHDWTETGHVIYWNYADDCCNEIQFDMKPYVDREIVEYLGDIWIFSFISNEICRIENSEKIRYYTVPDTKKTEIVFVRPTEKGLFFSDYVTRSWYNINSIKKVEKVDSWMKECVNLYELEEMLFAEEMPDKILKESNSYTLEYFIKKVDVKDTLRVKEEMGVGKDIYYLCDGGN